MADRRRSAGPRGRCWSWILRKRKETKEILLHGEPVPVLPADGSACALLPFCFFISLAVFSYGAVLSSLLIWVVALLVGFF